MKKELLLATTVAGIALGATSASAVTATMSGNHRVGIEDEDKDSNTATTGTTNENRKSSFSVSLEETLDSGTKIAGAFSINNSCILNRIFFFLVSFEVFSKLSTRLSISFNPNLCQFVPDISPIGFTLFDDIKASYIGYGVAPFSVQPIAEEKFPLLILVWEES